MRLELEKKHRLEEEEVKTESYSKIEQWAVEATPSDGMAFPDSQSIDLYACRDEQYSVKACSNIDLEAPSTSALVCSQTKANHDLNSLHFHPTSPNFHNVIDAYHEPPTKYPTHFSTFSFAPHQPIGSFSHYGTMYTQDAISKDLASNSYKSLLCENFKPSNTEAFSIYPSLRDGYIQNREGECNKPVESVSSTSTYASLHTVCSSSSRLEPFSELLQGRYPVLPLTVNSEPVFEEHSSQICSPSSLLPQISESAFPSVDLNQEDSADRKEEPLNPDATETESEAISNDSSLPNDRISETEGKIEIESNDDETVTESPTLKTSLHQNNEEFDENLGEVIKNSMVETVSS